MGIGHLGKLSCINFFLIIRNITKRDYTLDKLLEKKINN